MRSLRVRGDRILEESIGGAFAACPAGVSSPDSATPMTAGCHTALVSFHYVRTARTAVVICSPLPAWPPSRQQAYCARPYVVTLHSVALPPFTSVPAGPELAVRLPRAGPRLPFAAAGVPRRAAAAQQRAVHAEPVPQHGAGAEAAAGALPAARTRRRHGRVVTRGRGPGWSG